MGKSILISPLGIGGKRTTHIALSFLCCATLLTTEQVGNSHCVLETTCGFLRFLIRDFLTILLFSLSDLVLFGAVIIIIVSKIIAKFGTKWRKKVVTSRWRNLNRSTKLSCQTKRGGGQCIFAYVPLLLWLILSSLLQ